MTPLGRRRNCRDPCDLLLPTRRPRFWTELARGKLRLPSKNAGLRDAQGERKALRSLARTSSVKCTIEPVTLRLLKLGDLDPRGVLAAGASDFRGSPPRRFKLQAPLLQSGRKLLACQFLRNIEAIQPLAPACEINKTHNIFSGLDIRRWGLSDLSWSWISLPPLKRKKYFQATLKTVYFVDFPLNRDHWGPNSEGRHRLQVPGVLPQKISGAIGVANTESGGDRCSAVNSNRGAPGALQSVSLALKSVPK